MAFQLTISEGKEAGREFVFDQEAILIGRTDECDVILYDPGISRRHCRIFSAGESYMVEDMGSANGTKVNGAPVARQGLADGDRLTLGPVTFAFVALRPEPSYPDDGTDPAIDPAADENRTRIVSADALDDDGGDSTRIVSASQLARSTVAELLENTDADVAASSTRIVSSDRIRAARGKSVALVPADAGPDKLEGLKRRRTSVQLPATRESNSPPARAVRSAAMPVVSAAERARIRRESSGFGAAVRLFWLEASGVVRTGLIALGAVLALAVVGAAYWAVLRGTAAEDKGVEPDQLSVKPIPDVFGLGEGVKWERPDQKVFQWQYTAATRAVVLVHFQSQGVAQGEVMLTVNGADVGPVPPDTLASMERPLEMIVPPQMLKKGEPNTLIFDNTRNPPGRDAWRIWNVWVETALLPELPPEQLLLEASNAFKRGSKNLEAAEVGARNRYEAWRAFREAWLLLEAYPTPKPDLYQEARDKVRQSQLELDRTCSKLLLEVQTYYNQGNFKAASATLDHVRSYFPEFDQPCAGRAESKREEYEL